MRAILPKKAQLDKLAGAIIRNKGKCERCGTSIRLTWAHILSRRYLLTRWNLDNAMCLCVGCHFYFTVRPLEWEIFVIEKIGEKKYNELKTIAMGFNKVDYGKTKYDLEKEIKRLKIKF